MITVFENRYVSIKNIYGTQNENNVTELEIQVPEQYQDWNKRIVFITDEGNKWDYISGNIYKLKNNITKYQEVGCYIWLTKNSEAEEESIDDFRSETFRLFFNKNEQADDTVPSEEQLDGFNTLINELNVALDKVNDISSDIEKLKEEVTQTIEDLNTKAENGEFDGATYIPSVDEQGNISWTNDKGLPNPNTQNIKGEKGDQGKQGEQGIPGEKGEQGNPFQIKKTYPSKEAMDSDYDNMQYNDYVMIASNVDDEDNAKLYVKAEGETGWVFITDFSGAQGIQGQKGDKPIKGVDYFTDADKQELVNEVTQDATSSFNQNVTAKTNEFNNNAITKTNEFNSNANIKTNDFNENANVKTDEFNTNAQNKIDEFNQNTEVFQNRLTSLETNDTKQDELIAKLKGNMFNLTAEGTSINVKDASDLPAVLEVSGGERQEISVSVDYEIYDAIIVGGPMINKNDLGKTAIAKVKPNTKFKITRSIKTSRFRICESETEWNKTNNMDVLNQIDLSELEGEYTTSSVGNYIYVFYYYTTGGDTTIPTISISTDMSPDYPSKVEVVGDNINLFDKDNANILNSYIGDSTKQITSSANNRSLYIECLSNTTYTISKILSGIFRIGTTNELPQMGSIVNNYQRNDTGTVLTINTDENSKYIVVDFANNTDVINSKVEEILDSLKIEEGEIVTSYSPYGMGSVEINKVNKNWFDTSIQSSTTLNGINIINNNDGSYKLNGTATATAYLKPMVSPKPLTEYTYICFGLPNDCLTNISYVGDVYGENIKKFTSKESLNNIQIRIPSGVTINATIRPMLIEGNSDLTISDYIPHESEVYNLAIQQPMLSGDTFVRENKNDFEVHVWVKYIFKGTENFRNTYGTNLFNLPYFFENLSPTEYVGFSNYYKHNPIQSGMNTNLSNWEFGIQYNKDDGRGYIFIKDERYSTPEEFKAFLADKYNTENPVYIWYKTTILTKLPCTTEQVAVLEKLYNSNTYRPVTNIFTQEDLANLKLSYVADSKIYVDNKINAMQANLDTINQLLSTTGTSSILLSNLQTDLESEVM